MEQVKEIRKKKVIPKFPRFVNNSLFVKNCYWVVYITVLRLFWKVTPSVYRARGAVKRENGPQLPTLTKPTLYLQKHLNQLPKHLRTDLMPMYFWFGGTRKLKKFVSHTEYVLAMHWQPINTLNKLRSRSYSLSSLTISKKCLYTSGFLTVFSESVYRRGHGKAISSNQYLMKRPKDSKIQKATGPMLSVKLRKWRPGKADAFSTTQPSDFLGMKKYVLFI